MYQKRIEHFGAVKVGLVKESRIAIVMVPCKRLNSSGLVRESACKVIHIVQIARDVTSIKRIGRKKLLAQQRKVVRELFRSDTDVEVLGVKIS